MPIGRITHQFTFKRVYERAKTPQINYEDIIRSFITKQVLLKLCVKKSQDHPKTRKSFQCINSQTKRFAAYLNKSYPLSFNFLL